MTGRLFVFALLVSCRPEADDVETPVRKSKEQNPASLVVDAYKAGRESVQIENEMARLKHESILLEQETARLEHERDEMLRVVKFIECLDREVGHTVRGPEVERHIKKNTKAARTCKAEAKG